MRLRFFLVICVFLIFMTGCTTGSIQRADLKTAPPAAMQFETYLFESGTGWLWRIAFLKHPDSPVPIRIAQPDITLARGTYSEAMDFMTKMPGPLRIDAETVTYKGKIVGYLMTQLFPVTTIYPLVVSVTEKSGHLLLHIHDLELEIHR
ncbi:MAG: hypothetical protein FD164_1777 [Nitrospirae bacterium]|nr:MAG: hypothetical protein FD164_1777 [Nitrospirota bacterium]